VTKQWTVKWPYIANAVSVSELQKNSGEKNYFVGFTGGDHPIHPPLGLSPPKPPVWTMWQNFILLFNAI